MLSRDLHLLLCGAVESITAELLGPKPGPESTGRPTIRREARPRVPSSCSRRPEKQLTIVTVESLIPGTACCGAVTDRRVFVKDSGGSACSGEKAHA